MGRQILTREKELTPVGMLLGMILAIVCIALHVAVPFLNIFSWFAYILFILGYGCALAGLFNRLGSSMDGTRLPQEKAAILFGAGLGLIFAVSLIVILALTGSLPLLAVAGISKVFFDLFVLHKTLFTLAFILSLTSLSTSFFDYFAKSYCFFKYTCRLGSQDKLLNERIESRYHEYRGAFLGLGTGVLLALGVIVGLIVTGSLAAAPLAVGVTLCITMISCGSAISALFSRIGRVIDGFKRPSVYSVAVKDKPMDKSRSLEVNETDQGKKQALEIQPKNLNENNVVSFVSNLSGSKINYHENKVEIHCIERLLVTGTYNIVNSTAKQESEWTYSRHIMDIHLGNRPADIFDDRKDSLVFRANSQNRATFFHLNGEKQKGLCPLHAGPRYKI